MVILATRLAVRVQANIGIIRAGVAQGFSATGIQGLIRATGQPGIRRTDLLAGIRHVQGIVESATRIRSTRLDFFPDPARITQAKGTLISNFSYEVRVRAFDRRQGRVVDRFLTIRSDRNLTPRMIQEEAQQAVDEAPDDRETGQLSEVESITLVGARRK